MVDEISLYKKLNTLQAKMLKFHEEISPIKVQEAKRRMLPQDEENKFLSTCISIAFIFLKIFVCMIGPTLFPAIIYCIEGSSQLFWQVTVVSCIITLLLAMMTVTIICMNVEKVQAKIKEMVTALNTVFNIGPLRYLWEVLTSDFIKMNIRKVLYLVVILFITGLFSYITYVKTVWIGFYASLIAVGFIFGILTTVICDLLRSPELLPFHSPCKIKMALTTPSPRVKRELEFKSYREQNLTRGSRFSASNITLLKGNHVMKANTQLDEDKNITSSLPHYSSSINHEKVTNTTFYQLPINFSDFFRGLQ